MGRRQRRFDKEGIDMMEIERPKIETASLSPDGRYGKFVAEPLERGFGITLGNSLRRVLLSSLPGVAVTSVKIDGVVHEFSTIEGVKEDVTEIVLNLKGIAAKLYTDGPKTVRVEAVGPCEVTADNIKQGDDIEILNPEWHIATLGEGGKLVMELTFDKGRGYVPAERNKQAIIEKNDINTLPVDSIYTPGSAANAPTGRTDSIMHTASAALRSLVLFFLMFSSSFRLLFCRLPAWKSP
jgi:DNA-directed RNA polymerase subunit alpha